MTDCVMGPEFHGEGKPPKGWKDGDYTEWIGEGGEHWLRIGVITNPIWRSSDQYRLEASHPHYQPDQPDDAATLERLRSQYPNAQWPECLPEPEERAVVIAREWRQEWRQEWTAGKARDAVSIFVARKLLAEGVIK